MSIKPLLTPILDDDRLTRGLGDAEACLLVEWLVEQAEARHAVGLDAEALRGEIARLCRYARAVARFVILWCDRHAHGAACQLAASERFAWPLPCDVVDAYDLLADILAWEEQPVVEESEE